MIVVARNEEERLGATLAALRDTFPGADLVVADDSSEDATPHIALQAGARLVRAPKRLGKGGAATLAARDVDAEVVLLCDGDLGASAGRLKALVDVDTDMAIARFARRQGGGFGIALEAGRRAIESATGARFEAPLSGQRAVRGALLPKLLPFAPGFGMEVGMTIDAMRAGAWVVEVELDLEHRATGRTASGFAHRGRQLLDIARAYASRRGQ